MRRKLSAPLAGLMLLALSGCASTFDALPEKMGGLPESAPARPAETMPFPNVYEPRPTREKTLTDDEQKKLEADLLAIREQQKSLANPLPPPPPPPPPPPKSAAKPASKTPTNSAVAAKKQSAKKPPVVPDQKESAPLKPIN